MAAFDGCSGGAEKPVSGGGDLKTRRKGNFKKTHSGGCSGRTEKWRCGTDVSTEKGRNSRSDAGFFISDGAGIKGVGPMGKESMALLDMLWFCIHLTWIL